MTPHLKKCMYEKDKLKEMQQLQTTLRTRQISRNFTIMSTTKLKMLKQTHFRNALQDSKGSFRRTWQTINDLTSTNFNNLTVKEVKVNGNCVLESQQVSKPFDNHFASIGPRLASEIHSDISDIHYRDKHFERQPTNINKVLFLQSKLCTSKATGFDMISAILLRECSDLVSHSLCKMFNFSIVTGIFLDEWKHCSKVARSFLICVGRGSLLSRGSSKMFSFDTPLERRFCLPLSYCISSCCFSLVFSSRRVSNMRLMWR